MPYVCWSPIYVKTPIVNLYSLGKNHLLNYVNHGITNYKVYRKRYFNSSTIYHPNYFNNDLERTSFWILPESCLSHATAQQKSKILHTNRVFSTKWMFFKTTAGQSRNVPILP